jgi:hypothetical protein
MPDEVIAGPVKNSGGAGALPLFSFRHVFGNPTVLQSDRVVIGPMVASSFETPRESAAPQDEVFELLTVRVRSSKSSW